MLRLPHASARWFSPAETGQDCRNEADSRYLDPALAARATAIVSGDRDRLILHPWRGIPVLSPGAFIEAQR